MPSDPTTVLFRRAGPNLDRRSLREFAKRLQLEVAEGRSFSCLFTDDRELQRLNHEFLHHDYPTDVLSFPSPYDDTAGELAISTERAAAQATEFGHSTLDELQILMLHGVLHLVGMDHESDRGKMAKAEKRWRKHLGLNTSLIERARR